MITFGNVVYVHTAEERVDSLRWKLSTGMQGGVELGGENVDQCF